MSAAMDLEKMTDDVVRIFKSYESTGTTKWTSEIAAKDLMYQIGSFMKRMMQLRGERHAEGLSPEKLKILLADEIVDGIAELLFIAKEEGVDLPKAWQAMLDSDAEKIRTRTGN